MYELKTIIVINGGYKIHDFFWAKKRRS